MNEDIKNELSYIKCEIEDYFYKEKEGDGSTWTEQGIINYIYEKISQLIKD
jgi:hypothetical protein